MKKKDKEKRFVLKKIIYIQIYNMKKQNKSNPLHETLLLVGALYLLVFFLSFLEILFFF